MSDYNFFKPGLRWAREKQSHYTGQESAWCIVLFTGKSPFLHSEIVYETNGPSPTRDLSDPEQWQFGPEIEIPSKDWVEVRVMKAEK